MLEPMVSVALNCYLCEISESINAPDKHTRVGTLESTKFIQNAVENDENKSMSY